MENYNEPTIELVFEDSCINVNDIEEVIFDKYSSDPPCQGGGIS